MSELNDSSDLQTYSSAVLYVLSAVTPPREFVDVILHNFVEAIKSSTVSRHTLRVFCRLTVFLSHGVFVYVPCRHWSYFSTGIF